MIDDDGVLEVISDLEDAGYRMGRDIETVFRADDGRIVVTCIRSLNTYTRVRRNHVIYTALIAAGEPIVLPFDEWDRTYA